MTNTRYGVLAEQNIEILDKLQQEDVHMDSKETVRPADYFMGPVISEQRTDVSVVVLSSSISSQRTRDNYWGTIITRQSA